MNKNYTIIHGELYHYGVPGMRWGHRKKRVPSSDSSEVKRIRKKSVDEMSNQELQKANQRLELERKYKGYTKKVNYGKKAVQTFIKASSTITAVAGAYAVYKNVSGKALNGIGNWIVGDISKGLKKPFN